MMMTPPLPPQPPPLVVRMATDAAEHRRLSELCLRRAESAYDRARRAAYHSLRATIEHRQHGDELVGEAVERATRAEHLEGLLAYLDSEVDG